MHTISCEFIDTSFYIPKCLDIDTFEGILFKWCHIEYSEAVDF